MSWVEMMSRLPIWSFTPMKLPIGLQSLVIISSSQTTNIETKTCLQFPRIANASITILPPANKTYHEKQVRVWRLRNATYNLQRTPHCGESRPQEWRFGGGFVFWGHETNCNCPIWLRRCYPLYHVDREFHWGEWPDWQSRHHLDSTHVIALEYSIHQFYTTQTCYGSDLVMIWRVFIEIFKFEEGLKSESKQNGYFGECKKRLEKWILGVSGSSIPQKMRKITIHLLAKNEVNRYNGWRDIPK